MDFTNGEPKNYQNLKEIINQLDVGVLVNNVAMNHEIPTPFILETDELIQNIVEVNISGLLKVTKIVLPGMLSRNRGLIINVGSFSGMVATPYLSVYSGSKAFMNTWSQALGAELKSKGIVVENVNTYFVVSAMSKVRRPSFLIPLPRPYVKSVLNKIGVPGGASWVPFNSNTYPPHALANWVITNTFPWNFWVNQALGMEMVNDGMKILKLDKMRSPTSFSLEYIASGSTSSEDFKGCLLTHTYPFSPKVTSTPHGSVWKWVLDR
ncbi:14741_t:CDS:2 [Acaulospora colombiana]|uniref:14741_t:CDS:1 n=1 Tax=Acaulospora colombiana TaxID=27376 RepID=A0ACA9K579_9GLOM|nr:14741_t:CDS:2 [Acaulospora colombiana]